MIKHCSDIDCTLRTFCGPRGGRKHCQGINRSNQEESQAVDGKDAIIDLAAEKMTAGEGGSELVKQTNEIDGREEQVASMLSRIDKSRALFQNEGTMISN
jgi:hypothetical protein